MEDTRVLASEIEEFESGGDLPPALQKAFDVAMKIFKDEGNKNFILGKVIIENDMIDDEEEEETDDE